MSIETTQTNKKLASIKNHFVPSVVTAAVALMVAIPLTAALSGDNSVASADPLVKSCTEQATTPVQAASSTIKPAVTTASIQRDISAPIVSTPVVTSTSNGNGNTNGSGAQTNGNTSTNNGLVGVNANTSVSALNNSLNDVASHDNILSGNTVDVAPTVNTLTNLVSGTTTGILGGLNL